MRIEGCESLELHHLYRAMDFLEAHKEALEEGLYCRMADLLNLDVEVVFHDTTSLHFETDEEDTGVGEDDEVRGSRAAGAKTYRAPRKRGKSKNGRWDTSNCNASSRRGASSRADCGCVRSITGRCTASTPISH